MAEYQRINTQEKKEVGVRWLGESEEFACQVLEKFLEAATWYLHLHSIDHNSVPGHTWLQGSLGSTAFILRQNKKGKESIMDIEENYQDEEGHYVIMKM